MAKDNKLEPDETVYVWDEPYGTRKFTPAQHNARDFDRAVNYVTIEKAEAHTAAKVREALEEAAKVCESRVGTGDPGVDTEDADTEAKECAMAIRALIQNQ